MKELLMSGGAFNANLTRAGNELKGHCRVNFRYDGETHFIGKTTFVGTAHGHKLDKGNEMERTAISADCGAHRY